MWSFFNSAFCLSGMWKNLLPESHHCRGFSLQRRMRLGLLRHFCFSSTHINWIWKPFPRGFCQVSNIHGFLLWTVVTKLLLSSELAILSYRTWEIQRKNCLCPSIIFSNISLWLWGDSEPFMGIQEKKTGRFHILESWDLSLGNTRETEQLCLSEFALRGIWLSKHPASSNVIFIGVLYYLGSEPA